MRCALSLCLNLDSVTDKGDVTVDDASNASRHVVTVGGVGVLPLASRRGSLYRGIKEEELLNLLNLLATAQLLC